MSTRLRRAAPGLAICLVVSVVMVFAIAEAGQFSRETAKTFPRAVAIGLVVLCLIQIVVEVRAAPRSDEDRAAAETKMVDLPVDRDMPWAIVWPRAVRAVGWVIGLVVSIWLVGWYPAVALFVAAFLRIEGRNRWWAIVVAVCVVFGVFYFVIEQLLGLNVPGSGLMRMFS